MGKTAAAVAIVAAFACGLLAGFTAARERSHRRPPGPRTVDPSLVQTETQRASGAAGTVAPSTEADRAPEATADASPDRPQFLDRTAESNEWDGAEFARWYEIHRDAWKLPSLEPEMLEAAAPMVLALGRVPRREVLMPILAATAALEEDSARLAADVEAWAKANPNAPRDHPERRAFGERLRASQQLFFDRLYESLAYSDYLLVFARQGGNMMDELKEHAPPAGPRPRGADPYARPVAVVRDPSVFCAWYHAYRRELGLPARDREFLWAFCENVARPLGRAAEPELMARLVAAYDAYHAAELAGRDDDPAVRRALLERLREELSPLDFRRVRYSDRWSDVATELGVEPR